MTLTDHILCVVDDCPGVTAWGVAIVLTLGQPRRVTGSVSSIMNKLAKEGRVTRRKNVVTNAWNYYARKDKL